MFRNVASYVKQCYVYERTKIEQARSAGLMSHRVIESPWTVVAADIMGPFSKSKSGFAYVLVIQDLFTKWVECFALRAANGKKICEALKEVVSRWDTPKLLLTNNGTEFVNQTLQSFAAEHGITHTTVPPYYPQANSVEHVNRILKTMIVAFLE
ncbi:reverse ribonuclease integrase [Lasius niger]|uniref:Reverse ribonuclease integrase n=1 Tax=Lasius niger TaxID=67767 RepID=A0A0J7N195_LASNI|nr:reverse ribonuclease integrase [Lasius niger]